MITLDNVNFTYNTAEKRENGVCDISLNIKPGECVVLCGKSGCGKTTLTRLINGLIPNFYEGELTGNVIVKGANISDQPLAKTAKIVGSVFQNPRSQFFNVDTTSELAFGCENQGLPVPLIWERIEETSVLFNLSKLMNRSIFELSGGEKQRIAIASVYTSGPEIFVLDEPSSNLDTQSVYKLRDILAVLKAAGKTIVISEHRLYYLTELADRFIYMEDRKVTSEYSALELKKTSQEKLYQMGLRNLNLNTLTHDCQNNSINVKNIRIEFENIICKYDKKVILDIPSLSINKGEIVAVIGHNGAGKSTFAGCMCGITKHKGNVLLNGKPLKPRERIKKSYMVMQDVNHQLFTESVEEELALNVDDDIKSKSENILKRLSLDHLKEAHPMSLSGGQKQRVAVASAVCANKQFIIYDEPTSGLDYINMKEICRLIKDLSDKVFLTIVITHDLEFILGCCTSVLHITAGSTPKYYPLDTAGINKVKEYFYEKEEKN